MDRSEPTKPYLYRYPILRIRREREHMKLDKFLYKLS